MTASKQQYGVRWPTGSVFAFSSREAAESAITEDGRGVGVLVVCEYEPGTPNATEWREVEDWTMTASNPPSKRWRMIAGGVTMDYTSEKKAYEHINNLAAIGTAALGLRITIQHWEDGQWSLYERAVITENGWEPA